MFAPNEILKDVVFVMKLPVTNMFVFLLLLTHFKTGHVDKNQQDSLFYVNFRLSGK